MYKGLDISGKVVLSDMWAKLNVAWDGVQAGANADIESVNHDYSAAGWSRSSASTSCSTKAAGTCSR